MNYIKAILFGAVEGVTEWLPISSTGHMILLEGLLRPDLTEELMTLFLTVIQTGPALAILLFRFQSLWPFRLREGKLRVRGPVLMYWLKLCAASIPAAVLGLLADDWIDLKLYNSGVIGAMLILYGVLFLAADRGRSPRITESGEISFRESVVMGLWQALALVPGTSRSGAVILGGLLLGMSRSAAVEFAFDLAIPVLFGSGGLRLVKYCARGFCLGTAEAAVLGLGTVVSFAVSLAVIQLMTRFVKTHSLRIFGFYRIALGLLLFFVKGGRA